MTPDELRALADALPEGVHWSDPITPAMLAEAIRRFCADVQPVRAVPIGHALSAVRHVGSANYPDRERAAIERLYSAEFDAYAHPAPSAPQAEPKREDQPVRDLLAIIHCDGGHHTEAVGLDQSIKDAQAAVCELKREIAMGKREPLSDEQIDAAMGASNEY